MSTPIICFGQQPCGIFPNRFVFSKIKSAKRLQAEVGGEIVFFYHDSDHDFRETCSDLTNRHSSQIEKINFEVGNKVQKLYSPLYCKKIKADWKEKTRRRLPNLVRPEWVKLFETVDESAVADFCLKMYEGMGLLEGVKVVRSSDPEFRERAIDIDDFFVDAPFEGETVRARSRDGGFYLHKGGDRFIEIEVEVVEKKRISPTRDSRLLWMQSVIGCTHYIAGEGEIKYLNTEEAPEIEFVKREFIDRSGEAYVDLSHEW